MCWATLKVGIFQELKLLLFELDIPVIQVINARARVLTTTFRKPNCVKGSTRIIGWHNVASWIERNFSDRASFVLPSAEDLKLAVGNSSILVSTQLWFQWKILKVADPFVSNFIWLMHLVNSNSRITSDTNLFILDDVDFLWTSWIRF